MKDTDSKMFADGDKVELTVEAVRRAAGKCETAKEVLKELFPEVFRASPPGWEDVTNDAKVVFHRSSGDFNLCFYGLDWPFIARLAGDPNSCSFSLGMYKISDGRIWRKKSE